MILTVLLNTLERQHCSSTSYLKTASLSKMSDENVSKLRKILKFFEDPEYLPLAPNLNGLMGLSGLWHPNRSIGTIIKHVLFCITVGLFLSQYIKGIIKFDYASLKIILQFAPFHLGVLKACHFHKNYKFWKDFITYTGTLEQKQLSEEDVNKLVNNYINQNRYVTYFYWSMSFCTTVSMFSELYQHPAEDNFALFDFYTPFRDQHYAYIALQITFGYIASAYVVGWDTLIVSIMIFFSGQLKIAKYYFKNVIDIDNKEISHKNIVEFHQYYVTLIK